MTELPGSCVFLCQQQVLYRVPEESPALFFFLTAALPWAQSACVSVGRYKDGKLRQCLGTAGQAQSASRGFQFLCSENPPFSPGGSGMLQHGLCQDTHSFSFLTSAPSLFEQLILHFDSSLLLLPSPSPSFPLHCSCLTTPFGFAHVCAEILAC